jgi:hypothetical protein
MEAAGRPVWMDDCDVANRFMNVLDTIADSLRFFCPRHPNGISYRDWHTEVMIRRSLPGVA